MSAMWMVRCESGTLYDDFKELGIAAIGWIEVAEKALQSKTYEALFALYKEAYPNMKKGSISASTSQIWRFIHELKIGDKVVTYSPSARTYMIGEIISECYYSAEHSDKGMPLQRKVKWRSQEVKRDSLNESTRYHLGSVLTIFQVSLTAQNELLSIADGTLTDTTTKIDIPSDTPEEDPLAGIESIALERIKDMINELEWYEMQELVAGILRAMGYKTQISPEGADRGKDILASPDGFGFQSPRIIVEVKHRNGRMGSQDIRSFLGGRHNDDRGLYVSTGGFTKDAYYEADRAKIPLVLWTLDNLARTLLEYYSNTDTETKRLVPLKVFYIPA
ncbi:restriction endonuclease [Saezia sanguinis]|uniref:restriction endonuclease n=1 Tax=Saezia sanguinis TaxID=1965230 RepID=UPI00303C2BC9